MIDIKSVCLVYFLLLSYGFCHGGRVLNEEAEKASSNRGTGMMKGDGNDNGGLNNDRNLDSGDASPNDFRFRGIIGGWDGIPTIEVPGFDIPVISIPAFAIPSFGIGGGIDIDFGGSDDPELGKNGGPDTQPGDGGSGDDHKLLPVNPMNGQDSSIWGINNEAWENKKKMAEMMGKAMAMAPKESD